MKTTKKACLVILDGWGIEQNDSVSAINQANTPYIDYLFENYPNAQLTTFGNEVGLPDGQMGNSEVGHLNIGAGRVVFQELARINNAIKEGKFAKNVTLVSLLNKAKTTGCKVHLMGLVSDGGVHSHINHLKALCDVVESYNIENAYIHAFMDGRDTDPNGGLNYIDDLLNHIESQKITIGSIIGRYFAMDRDTRWERTKLAYDLITSGKAKINTDDPLSAMTDQYDKGITDEFMVPMHIDQPPSKKNPNIENGDVVICFNFRTDRPRQITTVLTQQDMDDHGMHTLDLNFGTMTTYDESYTDIHVLYTKNNLSMTIGEVISNRGLSQLRIAETEKYPHVTFFFNGGREEPFPKESRIVVQSPNVATYDLKPEMSAYEVTESLITSIKKSTHDFIAVNYANTDMVGHTGDLNAAIVATETVDNCLSKLIPILQKNEYSIVIIADHGNADIMIKPTGKAHTAHTTNPVPIIVIDDEVKKVIDGKLADVSPTILHLMDEDIPSEMTGKIIVHKSN